MATTYDVRFQHPASILLAGMSKSGKTTFVMTLIARLEELMSEPRCKQNVVFFAKEPMPKLHELLKQQRIHAIHHFLPSPDQIREMTEAYKDRGGSLIIVDDFGAELQAETQELFSVVSHHSNCSIIVLVQNLFSPAKGFRTLSLNANYIVVFKNPRDQSQITHLARQVAPTRPSWVVQAFADATKQPYSAMVFDFYQTTPDHIRCRSDIFNPHHVTVYCDKRLARHIS